MSKFNGMSSKQKGIIGGVAAAIVVAIIAIVMMLNAGPSDSDIEAMVRSEITPGSLSSSYVTETPYEIYSVKILNKEKQTVTNEEKQAMQAWGISLDSNTYYTYQVEVDLSNDLAEVVKTGSVDVVKYQGEWDLVSFPSLDTQSTTAKAGVNQDKVIGDMTSILMQASTSTGDSLTHVYDDGTFEIASEKFDADAQTDTIEISCKKETSYTESQGTIIAVFAFKDGRWSLSSATGSDDIYKVSYQKLVGTWTGSFYRQGSPSSGKCYGGQSADVKVVITSVDDTSLKVEGTVSFLAHNHGKSESDESSNAGDTVVTDQAFTTTLDNQYVDGFGSFEYAGSYKTSEDSNGQIAIYLGFGPYDTSAGADAVLGVETQYSGAMYSWDWFEDIYTLTKSE